MELALIPPICRLNDTQLTSYQLMLPHLLVDEKYRSTYRDLYIEGYSIILDNGAAESEYTSNNKLVQLIEQYKPSEFAIPDVLGDPDQTLDRAFNFLQSYGQRAAGTTHLGIVAQGHNADEACGVVNALMASPLGKLIDIVYVPRLLLKESNEKSVRFEVAEYIKYRYPQLAVHLFGASTEHVQEMRIAASEFPSIRSMDTSLPYNYAHAGIEITDDTKVKVSRPDNYFHMEFTPEQHALADKNVETVLRWAYGS